MPFSRNPSSGKLESYTDLGFYLGHVVTMGELISENGPKFVFDGGPGSGNHHHDGRPGLVGGSAPSEGSSPNGENRPKSDYDENDLDSLNNALSRKREEVERLRKKCEPLEKQAGHEWVEKILSAREDGTLEKVMGEYKKFEDELLAAREELYEAEKERDEIKKKRDDLYDNQEYMAEQKEIQKSGLPEADWRRKKAVDYYGYTDDFNEAGYMLPNGKMLNFCGSKGQHYGMRGNDHRDIAGIYANPSYGGSKEMVRFMSDGNIRVMAEAPGVDITSEIEPTPEQIRKVLNMAETIGRKEKYFTIDFTDSKGKTIDTVEYEGAIVPSRIESDIREFYRSGKVPKRSSVSEFHQSDKAARDGGPGSGNHNHAGRPGEVGGSAPSEGSSAEEISSQIREKRNELFEASKHMDSSYFEKSERLKKEIAELQDKRDMLESGLEEEDFRRQKAKQIYGTTNDIKEAAWLFPNGEMLDFDGSWEESLGSRNVDHRDIECIFPGKSMTGEEALRAFRNGGNIRLAPEIPGINLSTGREPTKEQYEMIRRMAEEHGKESGQFYIDFTSEDGSHSGQLLYEEIPEDGVSSKLRPGSIIQDIKDFYGKKRVEGIRSTLEHNKKKASDGGPGSGNHHHDGRPGLVGGSAPQGSGTSSGETPEKIRIKLTAEEPGKKEAEERSKKENLGDQLSFFARYMNGIMYGQGKGHDAYYAYNYSGDVLMNNLLRGGTPRDYKQQVEWKGNIEKTKEWIDSLTEVCSKNKLRRPAVVFRGISNARGLLKMLGIEPEDMFGPEISKDGVRLSDELSNVMANSDFAKSLVGTTFSDPAFVSTSIDPEVPKRVGFSGACEMEIYCPEGTEGVYGGDQARITDEREFILQRGTQFVVTDAETVEKYPGYSPKSYILKLKVMVANQTPKDVPDKYTDAFPEPREQVRKIIESGEPIEDKELEKIFPTVDPEVLSELNQIRKKEDRTTDDTYDLWDLITIQHELGRIDEMQASELEAYSFGSADRFKEYDQYVSRKRELDRDLRRLETGEDMTNYPHAEEAKKVVRSEFPNADESVIPILTLWKAEDIRLRNHLEESLKKYGDEGALTSGTRARIERNKKAMEYIARQRRA